MENKIQDSLSEFGLKLDDEARSSLYKASRWTKFISLTVFSLGVLIVILLIAFRDNLKFYMNRGMGISINSGARFWIFLFLTLLLIAIIASIYYFLYTFSARIKKGFETENTATVNEGFKSLKIYFIITTIFSGLILLMNLLGVVSKMIK